MYKHKEIIYIVTCEHATNHIPQAYSHLFEGNDEILNSHKGYDIGALGFAHDISRILNANLFVGEVSRLLVDLNRSPNNEEIWSIYSGLLNEDEKKQLMTRYYKFYRDSVEEQIERAIIGLDLRVIHISVHTFTPVMNNVARKVDIGILFDPERHWEDRITNNWLTYLSNRHPSLVIQPNEPYHGRDDGFTSYLRKRFKDIDYAGLEIEFKNTIDNMTLNLRDLQYLDA